MKRLAILVSFVCIGILGFGQGLNMETIHLKNGTVVTGTIVEYVPEKSYTIVTSDGNKFVFEVKDIAKITRELSSKKQRISSGGGTDVFAKGYQGTVELGVGAGMGTYGVNMFKFDLINGHRFNRNLFVGGGIGLRQPMEGVFPAYLPIFANARYNLNPDNTVVPMASLSLGAVYNSDEGLKNGGLMVNPGLGVAIQASEKMVVHATVGYDVMHMQFYILRGEGSLSPYIVKKTRASEAFVFNVGVTF